MGGISFAPVPGLSKYVVSSDGRVFGPRKELRPETTWDGYKRVGLMSDTNTRVVRQVHRLVLAAFVGLPPEGTQCAHMDGDPANNDVSNLAWLTPAENCAHRVLHGTHPSGENNPNAKLSIRDVRAVRTQVGAGATISGVARAYGVSPYAIRAIRDRKTWRHVA